MVDFGNDAAAQAGSLGLGLQRQDLASKERNDQAIQNSQALPQYQAETNIQKDANKVEITPDIAKGLAKLTGDDGWHQASGTKWDARIFTALVGAQSKKAYHEELLDNQQLLEKMKEAAKARAQETSDEAKKDREEKALKNKSTNKDKDIASREKIARMKVGASKTSKTTNPLSSQKALLAEIHRAQNEQNNPFASQEDKAAAKKFVDENQEAATQALKKIKESAQVNDQASNQPSGSDKTIPLKQSLPGLD